jgi:hypothetical protein
MKRVLLCLATLWTFTGIAIAHPSEPELNPRPSFHSTP